MASWIFNYGGNPTAIVEGDSIYDRNGSHRLWILKGGLYDHSGHHVGWTEGGVFYDGHNDVIGFVSNRTQCLPSIPAIGGIPFMPLLRMKPLRPLLSIAPLRPGYGGWSRVLLEDYIEL